MRHAWATGHGEMFTADQKDMKDLNYALAVIFLEGLGIMAKLILNDTR